MSLPLQPGLSPAPPWFRRLAVLLALVVAVLTLGVIGASRQAPATLLITGPDHAGVYARMVERLVAQARHRVWAAIYVIFPGDPGGPVHDLLNALAAARARGVEVRVALDLGKDRVTGLPDEKHLAAMKWLQAHDIAVIADELGRTTHLKVVVVDGRFVVLGSHNWTRSAMLDNREVSVVLDDPGMAAQLEAQLKGIPGW